MGQWNSNLELKLKPNCLLFVGKVALFSCVRDAQIEIVRHITMAAQSSFECQIHIVWVAFIGS